MNKPSVTDHAVLRYLERIAAIDVEAIRQRIHEDAHQALVSGATGITVNGIAYRIQDGVVVTVWKEQYHIRPLNWPADQPSEGE
jgi:hypothetical protein